MANGGGPFGITNQYASEFVSGFLGDQILRDYTHASKTFTSNSFELKPRYKFLFHVSFTINVAQIPYLRGVFPNDTISNLSLLVKSVDLPKYQMKTETLNQYNRKRIIQTQVEYQPVNLVFHDDGGDNSRKLWYYYFSYYYKDPTQRYLDPNNTNGSAGASNNRQAGFDYNSRDIYNDILTVKDWGYSGESWRDGGSPPTGSGKPPFFSDIRIYGMDQRKYAEYVLINPIISSWAHDTYNYAEGGGVMQHSLTINYETVKYYSGAVAGQNYRPDPNVQGFADPAHYDTTVSPIARPGANGTIMGQGGLLEAGANIFSDLQSGTVGGLIGAVQTAGRTYNTFKGKNLASLAKSETIKLGTNEIINALPGATRPIMNKPLGVFIPTPKAGGQ